MKFLVYGTLKRAFGNHRILHEGRATFLGKAQTLGRFVMTGRGVPFVWPHEQGYPLVGELYDIGDPITAASGALDVDRSAITLGRLDRLESNGFVYQRAQHTVRVISGPDGIMPLPRDSGDVHEGVWIYECLRRFEAPPHPDDEHVLHNLTEAGCLEWETERSKRPLAWGNLHKRVYLDEMEDE